MIVKVVDSSETKKTIEEFEYHLVKSFRSGSLDNNHCVKFAQDLIRIPSLSGQEKPVVDRIIEEMNLLGFDDAFIDQNGNAIGIIRGKKNGPTLLMDGHCDTVGVTNPEEWKHDPYSAVIEENKLYGRGAADMKSAIAAMVHAAGTINRSEISGTLVVCATVLEELMEGISFKAVVDQIKPDYVIIGEASALNINRAGRGRAEIKITTFGKSAHSSSPHLGINAVHRMVKAIEKNERNIPHSDPFIGQAHMVLTDIISDPYPGSSVIPNRCIATFDRRLLPNETAEEVREAIMSILPDSSSFEVRIENGNHQTYTGNTLAGEKFFPAWIFPEDHELVQKAQIGLKNAGIIPNLSRYQFCTNGSYSAGVAKIPTIGFGPGSESSAHIVNEFMPLDELHKALVGYKGMIGSILGNSN